VTLAQEQVSDAMWAISVLNGRGTEEDSRDHAKWILAKLSETGCTETIRRLASSGLQTKSGARA